jgi:hypothetical protein
MLQKRAELELLVVRKAENAARSYDSFLIVEVGEEEEDASEQTYSSARETEDFT